MVVPTLAAKKRKIVMIPGQGFQYKNMGKRMCNKYPVAEKHYEIAKNTTGLSMDQLLMNPKAKWTLLSILAGCVTFSCAQIVVRKELETEKGIEPRITQDEDEELYWAGLSAGMYPGIYASGALSNFKKFMELIAQRAECMSKISYDKPCMMKIVGRFAELEEILLKSGVEKALEHAHDIVMVGGEPEQIETAHKIIVDMGVNAKPIKGVVSPFHTRAYKWIAQRIFSPVLRRTQFKIPKDGRIISNVTAEALSGDPEELRIDLTDQLWHPVRWALMMERWAYNLMPHPYAGAKIKNPNAPETLAIAMGPGGSYFIKLIANAGHYVNVLDLSDERKIENTTVQTVGAFGF
ncbi:MAG: ACP S-malonyltransferase [Nanoarchaeota archaeon]|nr:ACP S-malonyltransferase [Nanoarchaeota archaeon]